ncbi:hypothetical protein IQ241_06785 [Romeria aff. gracilis LEGE 07310]|uniref:WD40 repeat domain-containing protein n=1 Tax=Vasconcelosia minhoensis LEGE 07310 TaxID=915328 RepID=A0A8J7AM74_9CYAN|nr:hypothetical protein [Romeria gracilis]MBE9077004.1 hypothetical protein [Romeria aff. gracilis LEGE 07310]
MPGVGQSAESFRLLWQHRLSDYVSALAWSADGQWLAAASAQGELVVVQAGTDGFLSEENWIFTLPSAQAEAISGIGFSADSRMLAAAGQAGTVTLWAMDAPDFPQIRQRSYPGIWIDRLAWHPLKNQLAYSVGKDCYLWDAAADRLVAQLNFQASSGLHLAWHPQGERLAVSGHGGVKVWSAADWAAEPTLIQVPGASLYAAWSAEGRYLASGNLDRTLTVVEWGSPPPWFMQGFPGKVRCLSWSDSPTKSGSPLLAAACAEGITVWERTAQPGGGWRSQVLQQHRGTVNAIAFQPRTQLLASAGLDGLVCLWPQGGHVQTLKGLTAGSSGLSWHPSGQLAVAGSAGELMVWTRNRRGVGFG